MFRLKLIQVAEEDLLFLLVLSSEQMDLDSLLMVEELVGAMVQEDIKEQILQEVVEHQFMLLLLVEFTMQVMVQIYMEHIWYQQFIMLMDNQSSHNMPMFKLVFQFMLVNLQIQIQLLRIWVLPDIQQDVTYTQKCLETMVGHIMVHIINIELAL